MINKFIEFIGHESVSEYFEGSYGLVIGKIGDKYIIQVNDKLSVTVREDDFKVVGEKIEEITPCINLDEVSLEIDDILYKKLKSIKEVIRKEIKSYPFHGSGCLDLIGDIKRD